MGFSLLVALALFLGFSPAHQETTQSDLDALALKVAARIGESKKKNVFVSHFRGKAGDLTETGKLISGEFSDALRRASPEIQFVQGETLGNILEQKGLSRFWQHDAALARSFAVEAGIDIVLEGSVESKGKNLRLVMRIWDGWRDPPIAEFSQEIEDRWQRPEGEPLRDPESGLPIAGTGGITYPLCGRCPNPAYTEEARSNRTQGKALFVASVDEKGRVSMIQLVKPLLRSLDDKAAQILSTWQMKPARDRAKKPVAVRVTIEFSFAIF